ncbi:Uncharacterised protein [Staphylococcus intermedius NCTC 11048]|uniref:Uncharacterized protein n=1 Tax=Staphylococcus intermedius NCTC 11048 TaxID=1141106 RepID=A0A380G0K1_STAIN|nr:Uncharacterised protein [Staphylococcus intermedius NCTC 11048]
MKKPSILAGIIILLLITCSIVLNLINIPSEANITYSITAIIIIILLFFIIPKNNKSQ